MGVKLEKRTDVLPYDELKALLIENGVNEKRFNGILPNAIPESGQFVGFSIVESQAGDRVVSAIVVHGIDKSNKDFQCSLSFLNAMGTIKTKEDEVFNENLVSESRTNTFYVTGQSLNNLPSDPALALPMIVGKKFKNAKAVKIWNAPFKDGGYTDKTELIEKIGVRSVAKFELV